MVSRSSDGASRPDDLEGRPRPKRADTILSNRDELNAEIQAILDEMTGPRGSRWSPPP